VASGYTAARIAHALGVSKRAINKRAQKEGWSRDGSQFLFQSLPPEIQKILMHQKYTKTELTPQDLAAHFHINIPPEKLKDPKMQSLIRMLSHCLRIPPNAKNRTKEIEDNAAAYGYDKATAYRYLARIKKGLPLRTSSKNHGIYFEDLGITLRAWDQKAADMAIKLIMGNKRRHQDGLTLYQTVKDTAEAEGLQIGTYASFMQIKKRIKPALKTYRDKGRQGLRQDVIPGIRRDATVYRPMECLIGDQHKADYYAIDASGKVATLELFCWMDFRTQLVWGAVSYKHYNRYTVGQALINAVHWGLPSTCYTDWGKPEESNYMTLLIEQLTGLGITTESIEHLKATPRHPQAKPIEGFFGNFDRRLKNAMLPGYCKRLTDPRENELQQKQLNQLIKSGQLLSVQDLSDALIGELTRWNEHRFKNRGEDNGRSPIDIYTEEIKHYPTATLSDDTLEYIFLPKRDLMIRRCQVTFHHEWLGKRVYYDRALADYQGTMAEVRYDPFDPWRAWIFVDGKLICEAEEWGMINPKITEQVEAKRAEQKALSDQIRTTYKKYAPPTKPVRKINRHEKEARDVKKVVELRVMQTSLERDPSEIPLAAGSPSANLTGQGVRAVNDPLTEFRRQFHPGAKKAVEEKEYKPLFALSMKEGYREDE